MTKAPRMEIDPFFGGVKPLSEILLGSVGNLCGKAVDGLSTANPFVMHFEWVRACVRARIPGRVRQEPESRKRAKASVADKSNAG